MATASSTKGAPSKVTNSDRRNKRSSKRQSSLRTRASQADRRVSELRREGVAADSPVMIAATVKADKLARMLSRNASPNVRHHSRSRNITTPNHNRQMRRIEGGAFGHGKKAFGAMPNMGNHVQDEYKVKLVDGQWVRQYRCTKNIHMNDQSFDAMQYN